MPKTVTPTFAEYAPKFMKAVSADGRAPGTLANYRSHLEKWLLPEFGQMHLSSITSVEVWDFTDRLAVETGPVARAHVYNLLNVMMKMAAERWKYIPAWTVRIPKVGGDHSVRPREYTLEECRTVIGHMPSYMADALLVALGSALRIGEVCGLSKSDWNREERSLLIERQYSLGKLTPTKTGFVGSVYPIMDAPSILDRMTEDPSPWAGPADAMFRGPRGARLHPVAVREEWDFWRKAAKLPTIRLHDLRHTSLIAYARIPGVTFADIKTQGRHLNDASALRYQHSNNADRLRSLAASTWTDSKS